MAQKWETSLVKATETKTQLNSQERCERTEVQQLRVGAVVAEVVVKDLLQFLPQKKQDVMYKIGLGV